MLGICFGAMPSSGYNTKQPVDKLIQHIINIFYRYPRARLNNYKRFGGYFNYRAMLRGRRQMANALTTLPPVSSDEYGPAIYFLTGKNYLYQTLFCIQSLSKVSELKFKLFLVDDGSFDNHLVQIVHRLLPGATIITQAIIKKNLDELLPEHLFGVLRRKRNEYPHIKKLTDIHTLPGTWKLVLDSDMLFWGQPDTLINWLKNPAMPIYMQDCQNSYGYSRQLMENVGGVKIPDLINVGVIGLNSTSINWVKLNSWVEALEYQEGASYYLEQALTAMLIGESDALVLPAHEYIVNPDAGLVGQRKGVLHHYVDLSKEVYFKTAWTTV